MRIVPHCHPQGLKDTLGFNVAALQHLQRSLQAQSGGSMSEAADELAGAAGGRGKREKKKGRG